MALLLLGAANLEARPFPPSLVSCGGSEVAADATVLALGLGGTPFPAPMDGVITTELAPAGPRHYFKTRIPVESGDLFALRGTAKTFVCDDLLGVTSGLHQGPTPIGSSYEFKTEEGLGVPLEVIVEPDKDGDGYGDETQDRCTRMPTTQDGCPTLNLRVKEAVVKARSILGRATTPS